MATKITKVLVVDNYDSFVFNLVQYLGQLGAETTVVRNDEITVEAALDYDGVLISPGPGTPEAAGISIAMIKFCAEKKIPLFGVCLGHQAIGVAFGATVSRAPELMHGKTSEIIHNCEGVFANLPSPFTATRYHSLAIERALCQMNYKLQVKLKAALLCLCDTSRYLSKACNFIRNLF